MSELYFLKESNLWFMQATFIPIIVLGISLHMFIMQFMWKHGKLKQPIDIIFFIDLGTCLVQMGMLGLNKRFYLSLSREDPGEIFCTVERFVTYGAGYVHRLAGTVNAVMRSTFVCQANAMIDPHKKRRFISQVLWNTVYTFTLAMLMALSALLIPGQEKSSQSWSNCRRTPEITRYNFEDFYLPHHKSKYDLLVASLTVIPVFVIYLASIILEVVHVLKTHNGMGKYLEEHGAIPMQSRLWRRQKNIFTFKSSIILAFTELLSFITIVIGKQRLQHDI